MRELSVRQTLSSIDGGCNACTEHFDQNGSILHRVWMFDLRGLSFRLCDKCMAEMIDKSKEAFLSKGA